MRRNLWLLLIGCAITLSACGAVATVTESSTPIASATAAAETPSAFPTVFAITAEVGTAEPVIITAIAPGQITPVTYVPPTATPIPPIPGGLGPTALKYLVLAQFPDFFFCDPDYYPVARADEMELARQRFPELQANSEEFNTILAHNNLVGLTSFSDDQILLIYREHKRLAALYFELTAAGYQFQLQAAPAEGQGESITGLIDSQGTITIQQRQPTFATCPICLAAGTLIDTPNGPIPVQSLLVGTVVWTVDRSGARIAMPVTRVGRTMVPASHQVVHLVLDDGRELFASPGHPTADGRTIGALQIGDSLNGGIVVAVTRIVYAGAATYDLLPAGGTGFYWANGILIGSTLVDGSD